MSENRGAIGHDHGYDAQKFYLGLTLDPKYVEGCLERIGEDEPEDVFRALWEDEGDGTGDPSGGVRGLAGKTRGLLCSSRKPQTSLQKPY